MSLIQNIFGNATEANLEELQRELAALGITKVVKLR